jgi:hypothetical protein
MSGASPPSNGIGWVMGSSPDANGGGFHHGSKGRSAGASSLGRPKGASPSAGGGGPLVSPYPSYVRRGQLAHMFLGHRPGARVSRRIVHLASCAGRPFDASCITILHTIKRGQQGH